MTTTPSKAFALLLLSGSGVCGEVRSDKTGLSQRWKLDGQKLDRRCPSWRVARPLFLSGTQASHVRRELLGGDPIETVENGEKGAITVSSRPPARTPPANDGGSITGGPPPCVPPGSLSSLAGAVATLTAAASISDVVAIRKTLNALLSQNECPSFAGGGDVPPPCRPQGFLASLIAASVSNATVAAVASLPECGDASSSYAGSGGGGEPGSSGIGGGGDGEPGSSGISGGDNGSPGNGGDHSKARWDMYNRSLSCVPAGLLIRIATAVKATTGANQAALEALLSTAERVAEEIMTCPLLSARPGAGGQGLAPPPMPRADGPCLPPVIVYLAQATNITLPPEVPPPCPFNGTWNASFSTDDLESTDSDNSGGGKGNGGGSSNGGSSSNGGGSSYGGGGSNGGGNSNGGGSPGNGGGGSSSRPRPCRAAGLFTFAYSMSAIPMSVMILLRSNVSECPAGNGNGAFAPIPFCAPPAVGPTNGTASAVTVSASSGPGATSSMAPPADSPPGPSTVPLSVSAELDGIPQPLPSVADGSHASLCIPPQYFNVTAFFSAVRTPSSAALAQLLIWQLSLFGPAAGLRSQEAHALRFWTRFKSSLL